MLTKNKFNLNVKKFIFYIFFFKIILISNTIFSQLTVSKLFNNHMVLQQNEKITVWGTNTKNTKVSIQFNNQTYHTKTNTNGEWEILLSKFNAGGPYEMIIKSDKEKIVINDILIGDVWVCSGQSNMEWPLIKTENSLVEISTVSDTNIRHFKIPKSSSEKPEKTLADGSWEVANSKTVGEFSAVGYYFAKNLRANNPQVPIGLINATWGGSKIQAWMNAKTLDIENPEVYLEEAQKDQNIAYEKMVKNVKSIFPDAKENIESSTVNDEVIWAAKNLDDSNWIPINVPGLWESQGFDGFDGFGWYRTTFELTEEQANNSITLHLGMVDDSDYVWLNGIKVGETIEQYDTQRIYLIDSKFVSPGKNTLAVKVHDTGGGGGIYGSKNELYIQTINNKISLAKVWKFKVEAYSRPFMGTNQIATLLYNKMIFPLLNYPIKGVIWYQGEDNANSEEDAIMYAELFPKMIQQWRKDWNIGEFPFLWVQLANYKQPQAPSAESNWAILRDSQSKTLKIPKTAQAVIIDIGEADNIHPKNKKDVGYRLSLGARKIAYNENIIYSGPTFKNQEILENKIVINFNHVGSGLKVNDKYGYVNGFAIAGSDKKFVWAKAKIENNTIIVWNETIKNPVYVRYAWGDNPDDVNLYNKEELPASPFRTDTGN